MGIRKKDQSQSEKAGQRTKKGGGKSNGDIQEGLALKASDSIRFEWGGGGGNRPGVTQQGGAKKPWYLWKKVCARHGRVREIEQKRKGRRIYRQGRSGRQVVGEGVYQRRTDGVCGSES